MTSYPESPGEAPLMIREDMLDDGPAERIDFEQKMSCLPALTVALIVVNMAIFIWELSGGALANAQTLIDAGALVRQRVVEGEVWRLVSAVFLHGSPDHLLGNCVILFIVGMACEHAFGSMRSGLIYLASGLAGSLLSAVMHPGPSVGASGAIFGVTGCLVVFFHKYRRFVILRDKRIGLVLLGWAGYAITCGFLSPVTDNFAHVGGFLGGALVGMVLPPRLLSQSAPASELVPSSPRQA